MTINTWLQEATQRLAMADIDTARLDSILILQHVLHKDKSYIVAYGENELTANESNILSDYLNRRAGREPVAYIVGCKEFYGQSFKTTEAVLIPRPESEAFLELSKNIDLPKAHTALDLGTGSGILGISYALEHPLSTVFLTDISELALEVARHNARILKAKNVRFVISDLLKNTPNNVDIVLANLPYVPEQFPGTKELEFEPNIALYSGSDGLTHYRRLFSELRSNMRPQYLLTESLQDQHAVLAGLAAQASYKLIGSNGLVQLFKATR